MNLVPIVFSFDDNLQLQAGVCITSLLENAKPETFYDVFILHDDRCKFPVNGFLEKLHQNYDNFKITYRSVGNAFEGAYEVRGITVATYYRLLIPEIIPEYNKIFYFDVDIIFQNDLFDFYSHIDLKDFYVGGVSTPYSGIAPYVNKVIKMDIAKYICGGTLVMNSKKILEDNLIEDFKKVASENYLYQDQDTLNIVCGDKIKILPPWFGMVGTVCEILANPTQKYYRKEDVDYALHYGIIHYTGYKPWKAWCHNFDIWWEYYRKSIYFDPKFYFEFYNNKIIEYDQVSLWKRVKYLLRYFKTRKW